jgi:hypothetical protein
MSVWDPEANQRGGFFCISEQGFKLDNRQFEKGKVLECGQHGYQSAQFKEHHTNGAAHVLLNLQMARATAPPPAPSPAPAPPQSNAPVPTKPEPQAKPQANPDRSACERFPNLC